MNYRELLAIVAIAAFISPSLPHLRDEVVLVQNGQYSGQYSGRYSGQYSGQWSGQYSGRYSGQYTGQSARKGTFSSGGAPLDRADVKLPTNTGSCGELRSSPDIGLTDDQGRRC